MLWSRRSVLTTSTGAALAAVMPGVLRARVPDPTATIAQGRLRGAIERGVCVFRGVPYAGDVSRPETRFKAPPPPPPRWSGVFDATRFGAPALQPMSGLTGTGLVPSENCLFLNIWTPATDGKRRPVMYYCHGGGFTVGSGSRADQNGANLAREHDVVVVETNHRLGLFGYLYLGDLLGPEYSGNQGLLDLVAGLDWVAENIAAFGGDRDNVMIFGESGGGGKTSALYAMPSAAPLFAKASIESPIGPAAWTPQQASEVARKLLRHLDLSDPRRLLEVPADQLLAFQIGDPQQAPPGTRIGGRRADHRDQWFWPMIDGTILPELPFGTLAPNVSARKPLIVGGCRDEAVFFHFGDLAAFSLDDAGLRARLADQFGDGASAWIETFRRTRPRATPSQLYMAIATASPWRAHAVHIAELKAREARAPVYSYILNYDSPTPVPGTAYPIGSPHASDISIKFNNVRHDTSLASADVFTEDQSAAHLSTARNMSTMWATFARTGTPAAPDQPDWKPYSLAGREVMLIDAQCTLVRDPEREERQFWQTQPAPEAIR